MRIVTALLLVPLAGCAAYGIPEGTPTAMLRFTTNTPSVHFTLPCSKDTLLVKQGS